MGDYTEKIKKKSIKKLVFFKALLHFCQRMDVFEEYLGREA